MTTPTPKKLVLVIDDDVDVRRLVARAFEQHYTVSEAGDGLAAVEFLKKGLMPDLIVCDVMMPRMDGLQFAKVVKADPATKSVPFIFLTARGGATDVVNGINSGARHYLVKPVNLRELLDKAAKILKA